MSEFVVNKDLFGYYARIPTGFSRVIHTYKVVSAFQSNSYCDVPLMTIYTKDTLHKEITDVLNVIHCGIDESEVIRVALKDCELLKPTFDVQEVKHSHFNDLSEIDILFENTWECDNCKDSLVVETSIEDAGIKYCPNCGAKMDEVIQNE